MAHLSMKDLRYGCRIVGWIDTLLLKVKLIIAVSLLAWLLSGSYAADSVLKAFVEKADPSYKWELLDSASHEGVTVYQIMLTSQTWRDIVWHHQLSIIIPEKNRDTKHALLFVTGGGLEDGMPKIKKNKDGELEMIGKIASLTGSPVAILRQVPNQPLFGDKKEDDLISYTYDQFLKSGDNTWPLLQPMVKSAVKAMDTVQAFCKSKEIPGVEKFVISGGSKRGWTTWLTGAVDTRVAAIAPMVIDTLRISKQMPYQLESWGKYSEQIKDYTRLGIQDKMTSSEGDVLNSIVDPYSYRDSLTMPKYLFMGTNDPYWVVDAVKFYYDDLKGDKSIHYVPNAGHGLNDGKQATKNLADFFAIIASGKKDPQLQWDATKDGDKIKLHVKANTDAVAGKLWSATQTDRDFRDAQWSDKPVDSDDPREATLEIPLPKEGFSAFYLEAIFPGMIGDHYSKCTRVFLLNKDGIL
jgi:PhoPQ-activated pathogenicity-related protein